MGDQGDDWEIVCNVDINYGPVKGQGQKVQGKDLFQLRHVDTGHVLTSEKNFRFTQQNCPRCVIVGDMETSCIPPQKTKNTLWTIDSGFFFPEREEEQESNINTEGEDSEYNDEL